MIGKIKALKTHGTSRTFRQTGLAPRHQESGWRSFKLRLYERFFLLAPDLKEPMKRMTMVLGMTGMLLACEWR